jgi:hypothetical protein
MSYLYQCMHIDVTILFAHLATGKRAKIEIHNEHPKLDSLEQMRLQRRNWDAKFLK